MKTVARYLPFQKSNPTGLPESARHKKKSQSVSNLKEWWKPKPKGPRETKGKKKKRRFTHLTASGQILSPPLDVQIFCSLTGVPVCAALTIHPDRMKIPTCLTRLAQSPCSPQKIMSPGFAWERGRCLPREEWYWVWAVRGMVKPLALQTEYWVRPGREGGKRKGGLGQG